MRVWCSCFRRYQKKQQIFLANQLSGNERTGLLPYQLAKNNDESAVYLQQSRCIHLLLAQIEKRPDSLWHALIDSLLQQNFNQSMMITKQMFMNGQTIDQIMAIRHLKRGTVTDHLIEWALFLMIFHTSGFSLQKQSNVWNQIRIPCESGALANGM